MKLYQNGDRCPCCGTILIGKSRAWLLEFSQLVDDLGLPEWPGLVESFDADTMNEEAPRRTDCHTSTAALARNDRDGGRLWR